MPIRISLQVSIAGIAWLGFEHAVDLRERRRCLLLTMQHERVVVTRRYETRGELQTALQHALRIGISPEPRSDLRQHAQCRHVRGMLLQMCAQQRLRHGNPVFAQRRGCFEQARVVRRVFDVLRVGLVGATRVADRSEVVAQRAPRVRHFGLERNCASQGYDCALTVALDTERQPELVMCGGPVRLRLCERFQDCLGRGRVPRTSLSHTEQQCGDRMPRRDLQDFRCLFGREPRLRGHQALRMSERGFERSDRF